MQEVITMPHPRYSGDEIARRGQELYEQSIRRQVETEANIGKIISIDIESGDCEIDNDLVAAGKRLLVRHPGAALYGKRIGYNAVYALGGSLTRMGSESTMAIRHTDFDESGGAWNRSR
jgi:hypothetical protein